MAKKPLKIAHLDLTKEWRGGQQQLFYLHKELCKQGISSLLLCVKDSILACKCIEENLPFFSFSQSWHLNLILAKRISRILANNKTTILHTHSSHALTLAILIKLFSSDIKIIACRRVDFSVKKPLVGVLKYNNRHVEMIICISDAIKNVMGQDGIPKEKLITVRSGVDPQRFTKNEKNLEKLSSEFNILPDHLVAGTIAALADHKDYPTLLRAAQHVILKYDKVTFIALGDGPDKFKLQQYHNQLKLGKKFIFAGYRSDVGDFLNLFDIFVLSSKMEGMGTSLLDAQSAGLPIVATNAGGIPEIVHHNENGLLVEKQNPDALANAIFMLLNNPELRSQLGENGRKYVKKFSYKNMVEGTLAVYNNLLNL